jgi:hypothetical protein
MAEPFSDAEHPSRLRPTRRQLVAGAAATLGGASLLAAADDAQAEHTQNSRDLLNVAATAEVVGVILNTLAYEQGARLFPRDATIQRDLGAAARQDLIHYQVLISEDVGAKALAQQIWIPDAVFASRSSLLETLEIAATVFINAYLLAATVFANRGKAVLARVSAELVGVEAVHRSIARTANGKPANDRAFMRYSQPEDAPDSAIKGVPGFRTARGHVHFFRTLGFGFGKQGTVTPGRFYDFDEISARTPEDATVTTRSPR